MTFVNEHKHLHKLLIAKFDDVVKMRTFVWLNLNEIYAEIYGGNPSLSDLAFSIVEVCYRKGMTEDLKGLLNDTNN